MYYVVYLIYIFNLLLLFKCIQLQLEVSYDVQFP